MAGSKRLIIHSKNLFLLILLVGVLSLAFHINLGYYELFVENRASISGPEYGIKDIRQTGDDFMVVGRSLNQHDSGTYKSKGSTSHDLAKLQTRLEQLEKRLVRSQGTVVLAVLKEGVHQNSTRTTNTLKTTSSGGLTWVDKDTVAQGNWALLMCLEGTDCTQTQTDISQKVNQIQELLAVTRRPDFLCALADLEEKKAGRRLDVCGNVNLVSGEMHNPSIVVRPGEAPQLVTNVSVFLSHTNNISDAVVWPLPDKPVAFHDGRQLLRIRTLLASVSPLRFYISPTITVDYFKDNTDGQATKETSIEDMLQTISELYGLGTASRWWATVQSMLLRFMLHIENEVVPNNFDTDSCKRCFHVFDLEIMCTSLQKCYVIQMVESSYSTNTEFESVVKFVSFYGDTVEDILTAVERTEMCENTRECNGVFGDNELSDDILLYLMDWRNEIKHSSDWLQIYPSGSDSSTLNAVTMETSWKSTMTAKFHNFLVEVATYFNALDSGSQQETHYGTGEMDLIPMDTYMDRVSKDPKYKCTDNIEDKGKLDKILTYPNVYVEQLDDIHYNVTVDYHVVLLRVRAITKCCSCEVRLENKYNTPGARNISVGLGETGVSIYIVDSFSSKVLSVVVLTIRRNHRQWDTDSSHHKEQICGYKQDCSMQFDSSTSCGLFTTTNEKPTQKCLSGDSSGQWMVPCLNCKSADNCDWSRAVWQPIGCFYDNLSSSRLKQRLSGKKLLFIGDSTNRGVSNYIIEQINGSLYDWDKTHSSKVYYNVNNNRTQFTFAYYPHFWLPVNHRPTFKKVLYQLIKSSLPLENNTNTVLVVGGVQWLDKQHVDLIVEALQRKGLSGITKVAKGIGAGFHQSVEGLRYVPPSEQSVLKQREQEVLDYAKLHEFHVVATFNMTISRYKDFLEGNCACHFHKVSRINPHQKQYKVQGDINAAYSQILLNQICD